MDDAACAVSPATQLGTQRLPHLVREDALKAFKGNSEVEESASCWLTSCNESKHVWNEGPLKDKENLFLLDWMEEWLGRKRPAILGREGAQVALEWGEKMLAYIFNGAQD